MNDFWSVGRHTEAVALCAEGKMKYCDIARRLGVSERSLRRWRARQTAEHEGLSENTEAAVRAWREAAVRESLTELLRQQKAEFEAACAAELVELEARLAREWAAMEKRLARHR